MTALIAHLRTVHLKALGVAVLATAFSAGLAFADEAPGPAAEWGLSNAATHAGKTVPVRAEEVEDVDDVDETDEEVEEDVEEESEEAGENCSTDPTTLTEEELAEMRHGSVVCWAAQQDSWPEEFENHGAWVKSWAQKDKGGEESTGDEDTASTQSTGRGHGKKPKD